MSASKAAGALVDARLDELAWAARQCFEALAEGLDPEQIIGFGLVCDGNGGTITAALNTKADHNANMQRYSDPRISQYYPVDFSWERYLRWAAGEWTRTSRDIAPHIAEPLHRVWAELATLRDQVSRRDRSYWPSIQFEPAPLELPVSEATAKLLQAPVAKLCQGAKVAFTALIEGLDPDQIVGFALFSDADGADIAAAVQTRINLAESLARYSSSNIEPPKPGFDWELYLRWAPGEWTLSSVDSAQDAAQPMRQAWDEIATLLDQSSEEDDDQGPAARYEAACFALAQAIADGWFDPYPEAVRVFAVMDGDDDLATRARWLGSLNPDRWEQVNAYLIQES